MTRSRLFLAATFGGVLTSMPVLASVDIPFTVTLSEPVVVTGTPQIPVDVGGVSRFANFTSGSGTSSLVFTLTPQAGDVDLDGITVSSPIGLNGGTIKDLAGNDATLTFTPPNTTAIKVDYPALGMDFIYDADGRYVLNGTVYDTLSSFLTAAGGSFTRTTTATYFDSTGTLQTASAGTPRFDYDPVTHTFKGLLMEETRTNLITNSTMQGAVAGTPGTAPTGWQIVSLGGLTASVNAVGSEFGMNYIDVRYVGTTTGGQVQIRAGNATPGVVGNTFAYSVYSRLISGSLGTLSSGYRACLNESDSAAAYLTEGCGAAVNLDSQLRRLVGVRTNANAATAYDTPYIKFTPTAGQALDFVVRVYAPQLELGAFPTSFIPTTSTTVARGADALTMPTGAWFNASAGALMSVAALPYVGGTKYPGVFTLDDGTGANAIHLFMGDASTDPKSSEIYRVGVGEFGSAGAAYVAGAIMKQAVGYATNNARASMDGVLGSLDTSVTLPTVTTLRVGARRAGSDPLNGWIQLVKYYRLRPSDTQIQLLTQ